MDIKYYYENTEFTIQKIADTIGSTYKIVSTYINKNYSKEYRALRKKKSYRTSKLATNNPSYGKYGKNSLKYKGIISDNKGYELIIKPEWYTGRINSKHVFYHHVVWCEHHNRTQIDKGFVIHHCDFDPLNNDISNLICMSMGDHNRLHKWLEGVTTISKESTAKWLEAHGRDFYL